MTDEVVPEGPPDPPEPDPDAVEVIDPKSLEELRKIDAGVAEILQSSSDLPTELRRLVELMRRGSFSGPLPPPEILEGYKAAYPDAPEIIFRELQSQGVHRRDLEKEALGRQEGRADRGQHYALVIVVLVLAVCVVAVIKNEPWVGIALFGTTLAAIVWNFIFGSRRQIDDLRSKRQNLDEAMPQPPASGDEPPDPN